MFFSLLFSLSFFGPSQVKFVPAQEFTDCDILCGCGARKAVSCCPVAVVFLVWSYFSCFFRKRGGFFAGYYRLDLGRFWFHFYVIILAGYRFNFHLIVI